MINDGKMRLQLFLFYVFLGSLPPSPADSGVSDVDPSSSSHNSDDERIHIRQQRNSGTNEKNNFKTMFKMTNYY